MFESISLLHQVGLAHFLQMGNQQHDLQEAKPHQQLYLNKAQQTPAAPKTSLEICSASSSIHQPLPLLRATLWQLSQAPGFVAFKQLHINPEL